MTLYRGGIVRKKHYSNAFRKGLLRKIENLPGYTFTRSELTNDLSNKEQLRLNRALRAFIAQGHILKISHGLYAKAELMELPNGETLPMLKDSFESIAMEALNKLGIKWELGAAIQEYNRGETTQIPAVFSVQLKSRFRGQIAAEGRSIIFEGNVNAR